MKSARLTLLAAGATAALAISGAAPAQAQAQPTLEVFFNDVTIPTAGPGATERIALFTSAPVTLNHITITFDFSDIAGFATVAEVTHGISTCSLTAPAILTCQGTIPLVINTSASILPDVVIAPTASATDGDEGTLHVILAPDGLAPASHDSRVRTGIGVNLDAGPPTSGTVAFGQPFTDTQQLTNVGANPVHGVALLFFNDPAFRAGTRFSNCTYVDDRVQTCRFDQVLNPGVTYEVAIPYVLGPDTLAPGGQAAEYSWLTSGDFEDEMNRLAHFGFDPGQPGAGGTLALTEVHSAAALGAETDVEPNNNFTFLLLTVTGDNGVDLAAIGSTVTGAVGDQVVATVGEKNNGPASIDRGRQGSNVTRVHVVIPPGTTAVTVPHACLPEAENGKIDGQHPGLAGQPRYVCDGEALFLGVGESETFQLTLRIDQVIPDAAGTASILVQCACDELPLSLDRDHSNNVAQILVNPTVTGGNGVALPATGNRVGLIVGLGGLMLLLGVVTVVLARRRRLPFTR
jgi:hypothetical protein